VNNDVENATNEYLSQCHSCMIDDHLTCSSLNSLNANPNLIFSLLLISASSDQLFVMLKICGNALTLL